MECILVCVAALALDYYRFDGIPRLAEAPAWEMTQGIALSLELDTLQRHVYFRNRVHGEMDTSQFRLVGWQFEVGMRIGPFEIYKGHHSQHILEAAHPWMRFPVQDTIGVRLNILGDK